MRFDLERDGVAPADVDDAGIFARPLQHRLAAGRKFAEVQAGAFIGAVLAPHHTEDAEFCEGRLAAQEADDFVVLRGRELMRGNDFVRNAGFGARRLCH